MEQWTNDQSAADFLAEIAKRGEGVYDVDLPQNVKDGRFLSSIVEITPNKARVIVTPNGSIITAYPYNNSWECGRYV